VSSTEAERLADLVREHSPAVAVEVTEAFLERHPDWRLRYGSRATTAGVQDAGYHLAFLAGAVEAGDRHAFAAYARWAAGVLAARDIAGRFLAENLEQLEQALAGRLGAARAAVLGPYFRTALDAVSSAPPVPPEARLSLAAEVFLQSILTGQRHAALQIARESLRNGLSVEDLYVDVLQPALYTVGARWEANQLTVAQEHIATAIVQYVMAQVYEAPDFPQGGKGTVVLAGVEGELHNIGAVMVGDLLESSGWQVRFLGSNLPSASIVAAIRDAVPTHVGISATMLFNVPVVRQLIAAIRAEFAGRVRILVGGAAFRSSPGLWQHVEADAYAPDLRGVRAVLS
jgi:MerR family transcriptional regulator, light-induced transcriptional regulator